MNGEDEMSRVALGFIIGIIAAVLAAGGLVAYIVHMLVKHFAR